MCQPATITNLEIDVKTQLTDLELAQCLIEAEERKSDSNLPIDVRVRSFQTYAICLREADNRGHDYAAMKRLYDAACA